MTKTLELTDNELKIIKEAMRHGMEYITRKTLVMTNEGRKLVTDINKIYVKLIELEKETN